MTEDRREHALASTGSTEVDRRAVLDRGVLVARDRHKLLFPELVSRELSSTLDEVADGRGAETGEKRGGALGRDDMPRAAEQVELCERGVNLDARLDDIDGCGCERYEVSMAVCRDSGGCLRVMPPCVIL